MLLTLSLATSLLALATPPASTLTLRVDPTTPLHVTRRSFLGVNIDSASLYYDLDFNNPGLGRVAAAIGRTRSDPSQDPRTDLRIGGSTAESVVFGNATTPANNVPVSAEYLRTMFYFATMSNMDVVFDLNCMNQRIRNTTTHEDLGWNSTNAEALLTFIASRPAMRRALRAVQLGNEPGHWLSENPGAPTAAQHGADFRSLRALLDRIFHPYAKDAPPPIIQGPDVCFGLGHMGPTGFDKCSNLTYFKTLLNSAGDAIKEVTVHSYALANNIHNKSESECNTVSQLLNFSLFEATMTTTLRDWRTAQLAEAPNATIVLSETATAGDGGCANLSNTFASSFIYMNLLRLASSLGYSRVYRQDLVGWSGISTASSYALAGDPGWTNGSLSANPDLFVTMLWKQLVGVQVLKSSFSTIPSEEEEEEEDSYVRKHVRIHAACAGGDYTSINTVTVAFVNAGGSRVELHLDEDATSGLTPISNPRDGPFMWSLTSGNYAPNGSSSFTDNHDDDDDHDHHLDWIASRRVRLNGDLLPNDASSNTSTKFGVLPPPIVVSDLGADGKTLTLAAYSVGFIVLVLENDMQACASSALMTTSVRWAAAARATVEEKNHVFVAKSGGEKSTGCVKLRSPSADDYQTNTQRMQAALDKGGCVSIGGGDWPTSGIRVHVNGTRLRLENDARLLNVINVTRLSAGKSVVFLDHVHNVTVEGGGILYGNAEDAWSFYSPVDNRMQPRVADGGRAHLLYLLKSVDIVVRDLHLHNSTDWNFRLDACRNVYVDNVDIYGDSRWPNNDGFDPQSSINVTLVNSRIDVADDGICPKAAAGSGPLRGLYVKNVTIRSNSHAIKFGSNTDTEMSDIVFDNITIWDSNGGLSLQQRTEGDIHDVTWSNIVMETRYKAPRWWGNGGWLEITNTPRGDGHAIGNVYNMRFVNITATSENGGLLSGLSGPGIRNITFEHVHVTIAASSNYSAAGGNVTCYATTEICTNETHPKCTPKPPASLPKNAQMPCMGTRDYRPTPPGAVDGNPPEQAWAARLPSKADGIAIENGDGITFGEDVVIKFVNPKSLHSSSSSSSSSRLPWFGECVTMDALTRGVVGADDVTCINGGK